LIIKARFRRAHGIVSHVLDPRENKSVAIRDDLARFAPHDVGAAIRAMATIAECNRRTKRHILEVIIASRNPIHEDQLKTVLNWIDDEFAIAPANGRVVIEHEKGNRGAHFHVVFGLVNPMTMKALNSSRSFEKSEFLGRRFELTFNQPITGDKISDSTIKRLQGLGFNAVSPTGEPRRGERVGRGNRRQLARMGHNVGSICKTIGECFRASSDDEDLMRQLKAKGILLAMGDKAVIAVTLGGAQISFVRALRQDAKDRGEPTPIDVDNMTFNRRFADLSGLDQVLLRVKNSDDIWRQVMREAQRSIFRGFRKRSQELSRTIHMANDTQFRNEELRVANATQRKDTLRKARVMRAILAAEMVPTTMTLEKANVGAKARIAMMKGGLGLSLMAQGVAANHIPAAERARALNLATYWKRRSKLDRRLARLVAAQRAAGSKVDMPAQEHPGLLTDMTIAMLVVAGYIFNLIRKGWQKELTGTNAAILSSLQAAPFSKLINKILDRPNGFDDLAKIASAYDERRADHVELVRKTLTPVAAKLVQVDDVQKVVPSPAFMPPATIDLPAIPIVKELLKDDQAKLRRRRIVHKMPVRTRGGWER
jgi:nicotinamidase-related amidase